MLIVAKADLEEVKTGEPKTVEKTRMVFPRIKATTDSPVTHVMNEGVTFDFEGIAVSQLYRLATKQLVIDMQSKFRKATDAEQNNGELWERVWNVKEMLDTQRVPATNAVKADRALEKLTDEERTALFDRYLQDK